jgi:hypothetical protein
LVIWYLFDKFWYVVARKIWQPCSIRQKWNLESCHLVALNVVRVLPVKISVSVGQQTEASDAGLPDFS